VTPVAVCDERVLERNLEAMARLADGTGLRLRPHAKTHKSAWLGARQQELGASGLTVATLHEAEVFAAAGVGDLLLAHPPAGEPKLRRLVALAERVARLAVALDDVGLATQLPPSVDVMWEVDSGLHRVGTPPGEPTRREVLKLVDAIGAERFRGLMTHAGYAYAAADPPARQAAAEQEARALLDTAELLRADRIEVRELSVGSTPTARFVRSFPGVTEMRPGTYVYGDANQVTLESQALDDCALGVVATVVSTPERGRAILDSGSKALSADLRAGGLQSYGLVAGRSDLFLERLNEEHAVVTAKAATGLRVGDRLVVIPAHCCTTVNLHEAVLMVSEGDVRWDPVSARGWR
jgi:D-serine deaminase-like pyridoxal phosphate-dependent protein